MTLDEVITLVCVVYIALYATVNGIRNYIQNRRREKAQIQVLKQEKARLERQNYLLETEIKINNFMKEVSR